jgi:hypothetical protein
MFRTRYEPLARLRELRLPGPERAAARAKRRAEREIRHERDNAQLAQRRAAAAEAEGRRHQSYHG